MNKIIIIAILLCTTSIKAIERMIYDDPFSGIYWEDSETIEAIPAPLPIITPPTIIPNESHIAPNESTPIINHGDEDVTAVPVFTNPQTINYLELVPGAVAFGAITAMLLYITLKHN